MRSLVGGERGILDNRRDRFREEHSKFEIGKKH